MQREHWHLTEGLIFAHFAVFILSATMPEGLRALALIPGNIGACSTVDVSQVVQVDEMLGKVAGPDHIDLEHVALG